MKKYVEQVTVARPNWCVPAALEMVLLHNGLMTLSQDTIAHQLEITPVAEDADHRNWGAQIKADTLNRLFADNHISLQEEYVPISHFQDEYFMADKIQESLQQDISIICGYNYTWLFGDREDTYQHVSIIVELLEHGDRVCVLDPGPKDAGYKIVKTVDLFYAIKAAKDGLWCIKKT